MAAARESDDGISDIIMARSGISGKNSKQWRRSAENGGSKRQRWRKHQKQ